MAKMVRRRGLRKRRGLRRRMGKLRRGVKRNTNFIGGPNTCKISETYDLGDFNSNTPVRIQKAGITPGFRAAAVAPNFGLYRVAYMQFTLRPYYDTYTPNLGQAGGGQIGNQPDAVPYLYWKMNRYGDAPAAFTATYLRQQGSKPIRLDDKIIKWGYKPNILLADSTNPVGLTSGQIKITPWLNTDSAPQDNAFALSSTVHYGHLMYVEGQASGNAMPAIGRLELKVIYEFKNPRGINSSSQTDMHNTQVPTVVNAV